MVIVDGARGEGGGQILRTALALSMCFEKPFRIDNIRATRSRPGLRRQHLTAVQAAARVSAAHVQGAVLGGTALEFRPAAVRPGSYRFDVGTAGSTSLVLQTVLPALLSAPGTSRLVLEGGTHNPQAPPFEFLEQAFLPLVNRMGPQVTARLVRPGFYPAGGGCVEVTVEPAERLAPLALLERGPVVGMHAAVWLSGLARHIAERECTTLRAALELGEQDVVVLEVEAPRGPGNAVVVTVQCAFVSEVFVAFGQRGVPAEAVAANAAEAVHTYLAAGVPVGSHLADQLLVPMALAGGGAYVSVAPSSHTRTNIEVVRQFADVEIDCRPTASGWRIDVG